MSPPLSPATPIILDDLEATCDLRADVEQRSGTGAQGFLPENAAEWFAISGTNPSEPTFVFVIGTLSVQRVMISNGAFGQLRV